MIRLKVEWRCACSGCGTELVTDFFDDSVDVAACPWCGCIADSPQSSTSDAMREYVLRAIKDIEATANGKVPVKS